jgi:enoyl-[acyl-carrier-protein] reductase (NADH)
MKTVTGAARRDADDERQDDVRNELPRRRKVIPTCSVMGPVKAALESCCRYLAYEASGKSIRVHAISPGPLKTRAASGLKDFDLLLAEVAQRAPISELVDIMDVGFTCAWSCSAVCAAAVRRDAVGR